MAPLLRAAAWHHLKRRPCSGQSKAACRSSAQRTAHLYSDMAPAGSLLPLLKHASAILNTFSSHSAEQAGEDALQQLKSVVFAITSTGRHDTDLTDEESRALWDLVVVLWVGLEPGCRRAEGRIAEGKFTSCTDTVPTCACGRHVSAMQSMCTYVQNSCVESANRKGSDEVDQADAQKRQHARWAVPVCACKAITSQIQLMLFCTRQQNPFSWLPVTCSTWCVMELHQTMSGCASVNSFIRYVQLDAAALQCIAKLAHQHSSWGCALDTALLAKNYVFCSIWLALSRCSALKFVAMVCRQEGCG